MDKKRLILLGIFILVCLGIGFLLYFVFFRQPSPPLLPQETPSVSTTPPSELPTVGDRPTTPPVQPTTRLPETGTLRQGETRTTDARIRAEQIVSNSLLEPTLSPNGTVQFYNKQDGRFYKLNANGELELLSDQVFFNVQKVTWSPKETKSIIEYPDGSNIYYDFATKKQVTLPKHWEEFSFDTNGQAIAAKSIGLSPENHWLITADPEGNNIRLVEPMGDNAGRVNVSWSPNRQIVATSRTGEALGEDREEVLFVGLSNENFRSMVVEGRGFRSSWSPQGDKLLYSVYSARSDFKPELWVVNAQPDTIGNERTLLNVNTWPEKCSFADARFLYCGVPQNLQTGAGIAPDVANNTPDAIYRIDTTTGVKTEVPLENQGHVVHKMFLGDDGKTMYFTDKRRPGLFRVPL